MKEMMGRIFNIQHFCIGDGPGIRTTVFLKGCNLHCPWCHNPESISPKIQYFCNADGSKEKIGEEYTTQELISVLVKEKPYFDSSGGGITFSGGEPLLQSEFVALAAAKLKETGISTAVDTAGCVPFSNFEKVLPFTDYVLFDLKHMDEQKNQNITGADNRLVLDNLKRLEDYPIKIYVRMPVVKGMNDSLEHFRMAAEFLKDHKKIENVELLPYHNLGIDKSRKLSGEIQAEFQAPSRKRMSMAGRILEEAGLKVILPETGKKDEEYVK